MFKKILATTVLCLSAISAAHAIDVNSADRASLESFKGIGPVTAQNILKERDANGAYVDAGNLASRVRGIGAAMTKRFVEAGMTFGAVGD